MGAITRIDRTASIATATEYFIASGSTTQTAQTNNCQMMAVVDASAMVAGDQIRVTVYEKVNAGTQGIVYQATLTGAQGQFFVTPICLVGDGWDVGIKMISATTRSIKGSVRYMNPDTSNSVTIAGASITSSTFGTENAGAWNAASGKPSWNALRGTLEGDGDGNTCYITASTANTVTLNHGDANDDTYVGCTILLQDHVTPYRRQVRTIIGYVGSTKVATVDRDFAGGAPAVGSASNFYEIMTGGSLNTFYLQGGTAAAGGASTITLSSTADGTHNTAYAGSIIRIVFGTGAGQFGVVKSYVAATKVATMSKPWPVTPDTTSVYVVEPKPSGNIDAAGNIDGNTTKWLATTVATPGTAGVPSVDAIRWATGAIPAPNVTGVPLTDDKYLLGTIYPTPTVAGIPKVQVSAIDAGKVDSTAAPNLDAAVSSRLAPTIAARTLDVTATGEAGLDWANIGAPTTAVGLTNTTILSAASVTGAVGSVTGAVGSIASGGITAASLAAGALTAIVGAVMGFVVEGASTVTGYMRVFYSALAGKSDGQDTTTRHYRDAADTKNRITATTATTGRTAVTVDMT